MVPFLQCESLLLARSAGSRQRSVMPAIEVEADGRRMRPAPPRLTRTIVSSCLVGPRSDGLLFTG
jgi:hypothetical protein